MRVLRKVRIIVFILEKMPFGLFCLGAFFSIKYDSGWWFFVFFFIAWLLHLLLRGIINSSSDTDA